MDTSAIDVNAKPIIDSQSPHKHPNAAKRAGISIEGYTVRDPEGGGSSDRPYMRPFGSPV
jgi:hypothetical protein